jgi:predicted hydrocarbon binding protein
MMAENMVADIVIRITLDASEEVLGVNGLKAVLNYSKMPHLIEKKPDYSFEKNFTEDQYTAIASSYIEVLGMNGAQAVYRMIGKSIGQNVVKAGGFDSVKDLPADERLFKALELYTMAADRGTVTRQGDMIVYDNPKCGLCGNAKHDQPICTAYNGFLDFTIQWAGVKNRRAVETVCKAMGGETCRFEIVPVD